MRVMDIHIKRSAIPFRYKFIMNVWDTDEFEPITVASRGIWTMRRAVLSAERLTLLGGSLPDIDNVRVSVS